VRAIRPQASWGTRNKTNELNEVKGNNTSFGHRFQIYGGIPEDRELSYEIYIIHFLIGSARRRRQVVHRPLVQPPTRRATRGGVTLGPGEQETSPGQILQLLAVVFQS
jgi:hypothetical protein